MAAPDVGDVTAPVRCCLCRCAWCGVGITLLRLRVQQARRVGWPLCEDPRLPWLRACCAVAEGAAVVVPSTTDVVATRRADPPSVCVAAVLSDILHRMSALGGREGMRRSVGSVYVGSVTRFLGRGLRGGVSRVIPTPGVASSGGGIAVSRDGSTLFVADRGGGSDAIHAFSVADGSRLRVVGGKGRGPLQFRYPAQLWVAPDDLVFVADMGNNRVQVLTPRLDFHSFVGVGRLRRPSGVCANADVAVVVEIGSARVSVFRRGDGALVRQFGSEGMGPGEMKEPAGVCFVDDRHIAVADSKNLRVSVFSLEGRCVRHVGVGVLHWPDSVVCTAFGELVVSDSGHFRVVVFSAAGEVLATMGRSYFRGAAVHGGAVYALSNKSSACTVFT